MSRATQLPPPPPKVHMRTAWFRAPCGTMQEEYTATTTDPAEVTCKRCRHIIAVSEPNRFTIREPEPEPDRWIG